MKIDIATHPLIWMSSDEGDHDHESDADKVKSILNKEEGFVLIAESIPKLSEIRDLNSQDKIERAKLFKEYKSEFKSYCAGMIIIGSLSKLPIAVKKAIEGMSKMMGVHMKFVTDKENATKMAYKMLDAHNK